MKGLATKDRTSVTTAPPQFDRTFVAICRVENWFTVSECSAVPATNRTENGIGSPEEVAEEEACLVAQF